MPPKRHMEALVGLAKEAAARRVLFPDEARALDYAQAALAPRKRTPAQRRTQAVKRDRKAEKNAETAALREEVFERSADLCESCQRRLSESEPGQLDHFWGRGRIQQTLQNCWALCATCHRQKTHNQPSAEWWLREFGTHAVFHGYHAEAERARARLEGIVAVRAASVSRAREGRDG